MLVTMFPWPSHFLPIVPLAWAAQLAGHEVRVAAMPTVTDLVLDAGLHAVPVGGDPDEAFRRAGLTVDTTADDLGERRFTRAGWQTDWIARPTELTEAQRVYFRRIGAWAAALADAQIEELTALARSWRADLIVHCGSQFAAPVVASALDIPTARYLAGHPGVLRVDTAYTEQAVPEYRALFDRRGVAPRIEPTAWIDPCPPGLQVPHPDGGRVLGMRHVPYNGRGTIPDWALTPSDRDRVLLTWGHTGAALTGAAMVAECRRTVEAVLDLGVEPVLALSATLHELLADLCDELSDRIRVAVQAPLSVLLGTCRAVVHHGGPGTMMAAVAAGVPQLIVTDQPHNVAAGAQLAAAGAGALLLPDDLPPGRAGAELLAAQVALLLDGSAAAAADRLRRENARQPAPGAVVDRLAALVTEERSTACAS